MKPKAGLQRRNAHRKQRKRLLLGGGFVLFPPPNRTTLEVGTMESIRHYPDCADRCERLFEVERELEEVKAELATWKTQEKREEIEREALS